MREGDPPAIRINPLTDLSPVQIPAHILAAIYKHAQDAYPAECCGWLSGPAGEWSVDEARKVENVQAEGGHPTHPGRGVETAYVFSPEDLLALNESLDGDRPARVIYHSHPNGRAYMSKIDLRVATSPWGDGPAYPVQQLVVGVEEGRVVESALFAWSDQEQGFVEIARFGEG